MLADVLDDAKMNQIFSLHNMITKRKMLWFTIVFRCYIVVINSTVTIHCCELQVMRMTEAHREAVPAPVNHLLSAARDSEEVEDVQVVESLQQSMKGLFQN